MLQTRDEAYELLRALGSPDRLIQHLVLVGEAADDLLSFLKEMNVNVDCNFVRLGVAVHDAGKIIHVSEMDNAGSEHEPDGVELLLKHGVQPKIARCCLSHARYDEIDVSLEELLVALADKLWKGKRVESLELRVIDSVASHAGLERWDVYQKLDECFESIASCGDERLSRSVA